MKKSIGLRLFSLFILVSACDKESLDTSEMADDEPIFKAQSIGNDKVNLENRMQWVSYLTAQALIKSETSRKQFQDLLTHSNTPGVLKLKDLLGPDVRNKSFILSFKKEFYNYQEGSQGKSQCGQGRPSGYPTPPYFPPSAEGNTPERNTFDRYVLSLLNDDCLEYYMPNGFDEDIQSDRGAFLKSSAHPLTISDSNNGYAHYHKGLCIVEKETINARTKGNIIIVRPFREKVILQGDCNYRQYLLLDFKDFLR